MEKPAPAPSNSKKLSILALGDSLTEGYYSYGKKFHPYSIRLTKLLEGHGDFEVDNEGISGELTTQIYNRQKSILKNKKYQFVIALGGTNDLGYGKPSTIILQTLKDIHTLSSENGAIPIAITIPDISGENAPKFSNLMGKKAALNKELREWCLEMKYPVLDLSENFSWIKMSEEERKKYYDDTLHFTPSGYDRLAELIYDVISPLLTQ